ncbi:MAG: valine--tRNA ligase [Syntrophobacterales bacterium]|jgi:valyl-tRNA synthetase|nr:valine--tRNA ligase [Syntrophobacterales bacterium]
MAEILDKVYDPQRIEATWYQYWEDRGLFHAKADGAKPGFSIVIPPPNVTGVLHMGHALNNTLQDILVRFKRMDGFDALWMPGTDHAGIATQNVVERQLAAEGKDRHALGRDAFIKRVWEWKAQSGGQIINQLKRLGCSCDWSRERFTMDEGLSRAVREVFVRLYEEGLIYKGDYIINWCPRCRTALADLEVEHDPHEGHLYHIKYPRVDGQGAITVATTRPETLLGDTAVAVHPDDKRYRAFHGALLRLPVLGREIPVIADPYVTPEFGTGALKITPAHDFNDFEVARRHNLPAIQVIDEAGNMTKEAGPKYVGMDRFVCREQIVKDLKKLGLLDKVEPYTVPVGHCYRCKVIVEPLISKQWFVAVRTLADAALAAVADGRTKLIPANWDRSYNDWMTNIRDWCISRQIWWGHRIPAWTCAKCGQVIVSRQDPDRCPCGGDLVQETDVLDTWFSSALWPFSTLGWPDDTPEVKLFYPTSVLVTAFDILFFWVARMMMMGIHFMGEVPFREVYIHALVRDPEGQKMSKSKGNVIDPLELMDRYGTDAFRFSLAAFAAMGRDVRLSEERIAGYRNFANKVWNACRFTFMNLEGFDAAAADASETPETPVEAWIMSRLQQVIKETRASLNAYEFDQAANTLYQFIWHEFCDWYLELIKPQLYDKENAAARTHCQAILLQVLSAVLRLLHPFMPFITEEIWQKLPGAQGSIMAAPFPAADDRLQHPAAEAEMNLVMAAITAIRNLRGEMNVPPSTQVEVFLHSPEASLIEALTRHGESIKILARVRELHSNSAGGPPAASAKAVVDSVDLFMPLAGIIDFKEEANRLDKELEKLGKEVNQAQRKMSNEDFLAKAPPEVVQKEQAKFQALAEKLNKLKTHRERIRELMG